MIKSNDIKGTQNMKKYNILNSNTNKIQLFNENKHLYPFIISIPHSGTLISETMYNNLIKNVILANMDWYLPQLYDFLSDMGFTVIINNVSRYMIDTNRSLEDKTSDSLYNKNLIYTKTTFNKNMYKSTLSQEEIQYRINNYYIPYHKEIEKLLKEKLKYFNKVYLIDLHSFGKDIDANIVLGNRSGQTLNKEPTMSIKNALEKLDFIVSLNNPYSGGYITRKYANNKVETLQLELSYKKYIDDRIFENEEFPRINKALFTET